MVIKANFNDELDSTAFDVNTKITYDTCFGGVGLMIYFLCIPAPMTEETIFFRSLDFIFCKTVQQIRFKLTVFFSLSLKLYF